MNKVITINLGGRSYSVEEPGYVALKNYLEKAEHNLAGNPDKDEIVKDINLAIAEKCETYLNASKNVVTTAEIDKIIHEMGPVEGAEKAEHTGAGENGGAGTNTGKNANAGGTTHKRLYRLKDTGVLAGVCSGLAAYFDIDVTIVRIIFIALTVITHGAWIAVYFIMVLVIPDARTPHEKAEAWGTAAMTAQDFIKRAKSGYENIKNSGEWKKWKKQMKEEGKQWKRNWHHREQAKNYYQYNYKRPSPFSELVGNIIGIFWLAFLIYISWYGYNHIAVVHSFFDTIGNILQQGVNWLRMKTGQ